MRLNGRLRIGIITGSGPRAGIDLWQKILDANRELLGREEDLIAPRVVVLSVPELGYSMDLESNARMVEEILLRTCRQISDQCDIFCIACNTLHYFVDRIVAADLDAHFVSIVDAVCEALIALQAEQVALLGSRQIMDIHGPWSAYKPLTNLIPKVEVPDPDDRRLLHELIREIKMGAAREHVDQWRDLVDRLESPYALLACTELPIIADVEERLHYRSEPSRVSGEKSSKSLGTTTLLDVNQILAERMVRMSLRLE